MKIAILTHYYNSINYGGALQAYALCHYLNRIGYHAEQLQYIHNTHKDIQKRNLKKEFNVKNIKRIPSVIYKILNRDKRAKLMQTRKAMFSDFLDKKIPHSKEIFTSDSIHRADLEYDCFIVGSDQVWNFDWFDETYFMPFTSKKKVSYAASFSMNTLTDAQKSIVKERLSDFYKISVREKKAIDLLQDVGIDNGIITADPTLLLSRDEWEEVASERLVKEKYIFVYYLGNSKESRKCVKRFANNKQLKIVAIAIANGMLQIEDSNFADTLIDNASPFDFISLIKHAEYVFTDSFHATLFSGLFARQFVVFKRTKHDKMSSRITQILELYGQEERFCLNPEKISCAQLQDILSINYDANSNNFSATVGLSKKYLEHLE